jgi:hypothetical protein
MKCAHALLEVCTCALPEMCTCSLIQLGFTCSTVVCTSATGSVHMLYWMYAHAPQPLQSCSIFTGSMELKVLFFNSSPLASSIFCQLLIRPQPLRIRSTLQFHFLANHYWVRVINLGMNTSLVLTYINVLTRLCIRPVSEKWGRDEL